MPKARVEPGAPVGKYDTGEELWLSPRLLQWNDGDDGDPGQGVILATTRSFMLMLRIAPDRPWGRVVRAGHQPRSPSAVFWWCTKEASTWAAGL